MGNAPGKHRPGGKYVHWANAVPPAPPGKPQLVPGTPHTQPDLVTIRWEQPINDGGAPVTGYLVEHRRTGSPHWVRSTPGMVSVPELTLSGLEPGWRYQFRVSAENFAGLSEPGELSEPLTVTLSRSAAAAPHFVQELQDIVALENEAAEFNVRFRGTPAPKIAWYKDGFEVFSNRRMRVVTEGDQSTLTFFQAAFSDEGDVKCTATNRVGYVVTKSKLRLEAPPCIRLPRQYEEGLLFEMDEIIRLKVSVAGRPLPRVTWHHNGEQVQFGGRYEVANTDRTSSLRVGEARRADRGEYQVRATNRLGEDSAAVLVTVTDRPVPPGKAKVVTTLGRSVTLSWTEPEDDGGCKIGNYIVEYYRIGWNVWLKAATCRQLTTTLGDLIEGSEYKFRVKAENPYGVSDSSLESDVVFIPDPKRGLLEPPARGTGSKADVSAEDKKQMPTGRTIPQPKQVKPKELPDKNILEAKKRKELQSKGLADKSTEDIKRMKSEDWEAIDRPIPVIMYENNRPELVKRKNKENAERKVDMGVQVSPQIKKRKEEETVPPPPLPPKTIRKTKEAEDMGVPKTKSIPVRKPDEVAKQKSGVRRELDGGRTPSRQASTGEINQREPAKKGSAGEIGQSKPVKQTSAGEIGQLKSEVSRTPTKQAREPEAAKKASTGESGRRGSTGESAAKQGGRRLPSKAEELAAVPKSGIMLSPLMPREDDDSMLHGSSELMLVLLPGGDVGEPKAERAESERPEEYGGSFQETESVAPPMSLSAPELGSSEPYVTSPLRNAVSSTELLHEKAMARFYQAVAAEEKEKALQRRQSIERPSSAPRGRGNSLADEEELRRAVLTRAPQDKGGEEQLRRVLAAPTDSLDDEGERRHSLKEQWLPKPAEERPSKEPEKPKTTIQQPDFKPKSILRKREPNQLGTEEEEQEEFARVRQRLSSGEVRRPKRTPSEEEELEDESEEEEDMEDENESLAESAEFYDDEDEPYRPRDILPEFRRPPLPRRSLDSDRFTDEEEEETYHPRSMIPKSIETPPVPLRIEPEIIPKPIPKQNIQRELEENYPPDLNVDEYRPLVDSVMYISKSPSPSPATVESDVVVLRRKKEALPPQQTTSKGVEQVELQDDDVGLSAAEIARTRRLQVRQASLEEEAALQQVVMMHYGDLIREYGRPRTAPIQLYTDTEELKAAAYAADEGITASETSATIEEQDMNVRRTLVDSADEEEEDESWQRLVQQRELKEQQRQKKVRQEQQKQQQDRQQEKRFQAKRRQQEEEEDVSRAIEDKPPSPEPPERSPTPEKRPLTPDEERQLRETEKTVRSFMEYLTDLAMFALACYLYMFQDELLAIPVLLLMVYRQLSEGVKKRLPARWWPR